MIDFSDIAAGLIIPFFIIIVLLAAGACKTAQERDEWKTRCETLENILKTELHIVVDEENNEYRR